MSNCKNCAAEINDGESRCKNCGTILEKNQNEKTRKKRAERISKYGQIITFSGASINLALIIFAEKVLYVDLRISDSFWTRERGLLIGLLVLVGGGLLMRWLPKLAVNSK